ncbi:TIM21-domain-containing protein [Hanseniaspora valbyensis NRRL Y-1626]|uniref:Mitochondrial import inner membrane translocase subunit Tim21 n=1 Tax=Hanseniaspora valbyensis NRRL Y-1626 TaxID=766949 RepID=A0A1B7T9Q4_9ASCO|nr:TIM21-domain-containing protein [Hanseniaspora valbyensis NRRL Y-1626]
MNRFVLKPSFGNSLLSKHLLTKTTPKFISLSSKRLFSKSNRKFNQQKESIFSKIGRATTFTANGVIVTLSVGLLGVVSYLLGKELFSPNGDTHIFNRVVNLVEEDAACRRLLECNDVVDPKTGKITKERLKALSAGGLDDTWTRNRQISSMRQQGPDGRERFFLRIQVESARKVGIVFVEAIESDKKFKPDFVLMYLDVPGKKRHYLAKPVNKQINDPREDKNNAKPAFFLGVNWGPKK